MCLILLARLLWSAWRRSQTQPTTAPTSSNTPPRSCAPSQPKPTAAGSSSANHPTEELVIPLKTDDRVSYKHDPAWGVGIVVRSEPNGLIRVRFHTVDYEGEFGEGELEQLPAVAKAA